MKALEAEKAPKQGTGQGRAGAEAGAEEAEEAEEARHRVQIATPRSLYPSPI
jgi:hypothetical protein